MRTNSVRVLAAIVLTGILLLGGVVSSAETLVVNCYGGTFEKNWRTDVVQPFEKKSGATVMIETALSLQALAKMKAQKGNPQIDVVSMDEIVAVEALAGGLYDPLDAAKIPNLKNLYPGIVEKDFNYAGFFFSNQAIVYNKDFVKDPPKSWEDLWRPEFKGKILLPDIVTSHGLYLLVKMAQLEGGGEENIDPGFEKIKTLKPSVLTYYTAHDQVAKLLTSGEAWIAVWASDRSYALEAAGAPLRTVIPDEGAVMWKSVMGIPKGCKRKDLAEKYINFALEPEQQRLNAEKNFVSPVNKLVKLSPEFAVRMPYAEEVLSKVHELDWSAVNKYKADWTDRWNREITTR